MFGVVRNAGNKRAGWYPIKSVACITVIERSCFLRGFGITPGGPRRPTFPCRGIDATRKADCFSCGSSVSSLLFEVTIKRNNRRNVGNGGSEIGARERGEWGRGWKWRRRKGVKEGGKEEGERGTRVNRINDTLVVGIQDQCRSRCVSNRFEN